MDLARAKIGPDFYDCSACEKDPSKKVLLGHDGPPLGLWQTNTFTEAPLTECPMRTILRARETSPRIAREVDRMQYEYLPLYKDGHLLVAGGVAEQPARYLAFMRELAMTEKLFQLKARPVAAGAEEDA